MTYRESKSFREESRNSRTISENRTNYLEEISWGSKLTFRSSSKWFGRTTERQWAKYGNENSMITISRDICFGKIINNNVIFWWFDVVMIQWIVIKHTSIQAQIPTDFYLIIYSSNQSTIIYLFTWWINHRLFLSGLQNKSHAWAGRSLSSKWLRKS